jgi:hypothetical protein
MSRKSGNFDAMEQNEAVIRGSLLSNDSNQSTTRESIGIEQETLNPVKSPQNLFESVQHFVSDGYYFFSLSLCG